MTSRTRALRQARDEIVLGVDGKNIHVYDPRCDNFTRVIHATDHFAAKAHVTELRFARTMELLGYSQVVTQYLHDLHDYGRLEQRVAAAVQVGVASFEEPNR